MLIQINYLLLYLHGVNEIYVRGMKPILSHKNAGISIIHKVVGLIMFLFPHIMYYYSIIRIHILRIVLSYSALYPYYRTSRYLKF